MNPNSNKTDRASSARPRACYCGSLDRVFLAEKNIPEGFCGICERCGKPGHTQHFPGPVPYTGAWCDRCVRIVALTWPLKNPLVWAAFAGVLIAVATFVLSR